MSATIIFLLKREVSYTRNFCGDKNFVFLTFMIGNCSKGHQKISFYSLFLISSKEGLRLKFCPTTILRHSLTQVEFVLNYMHKAG